MACNASINALLRSSILVQPQLSAWMCSRRRTCAMFLGAACCPGVCDHRRRRDVRASCSTNDIYTPEHHCVCAPRRGVSLRAWASACVCWRARSPSQRREAQERGHGGAARALVGRARAAARLLPDVRGLQGAQVRALVRAQQQDWAKYAPGLRAGLRAACRAREPLGPCPFLAELPLSPALPQPGAASAASAVAAREGQCAW